MDNYLEQSVAGERGPRESLLYSACWAGIVLLGIMAMFFALNILSVGGEGMGVNWLFLALTLVCVALAFLLYRAKDSVYREYDYILWNGEFEVCAVYNRRRRKKMGTIQLGKVTAWGPAAAMAGPMHGAKVEKYCVHPDAAWCLVYAGESGKQAALLELNDEMCAQIRGVSSALRISEVKP